MKTPQTHFVKPACIQRKSMFGQPSCNAVLFVRYFLNAQLLLMCIVLVLSAIRCSAQMRQAQLHFSAMWSTNVSGPQNNDHIQIFQRAFRSHKFVATKKSESVTTGLFSLSFSEKFDLCNSDAN